MLKILHNKAAVLALCAALLAPGPLRAQQQAVAASTAPAVQTGQSAGVKPAYEIAASSAPIPATNKEVKKSQRWVGWAIGVVLISALVALLSNSGGGRKSGSSGY